jgi:hypothetical protein
VVDTLLIKCRRAVEQDRRRAAGAGRRRQRQPAPARAHGRDDGRARRARLLPAPGALHRQRRHDRLRRLPAPGRYPGRGVSCSVPCARIEYAHGRARGHHALNSPRTLDIDILTYGSSASAEVDGVQNCRAPRFSSTPSCCAPWQSWRPDEPYTAAGQEPYADSSGRNSTRLQQSQPLRRLLRSAPRSAAVIPTMRQPSRRRLAVSAFPRQSSAGKRSVTAAGPAECAAACASPYDGGGR